MYEHGTPITEISNGITHLIFRMDSEHVLHQLSRPIPIWSIWLFRVTSYA